MIEIDAKAFNPGTLHETTSDIWTDALSKGLTLRITDYMTQINGKETEFERYEIWEGGRLIVDKMTVKAPSGRFIVARSFYDQYRQELDEWLHIMAEASAKGISAKEVRKFITERGRTLCE